MTVAWRSSLLHRTASVLLVCLAGCGGSAHDPEGSTDDDVDVPVRDASDPSDPSTHRDASADATTASHVGATHDASLQGDTPEDASTPSDAGVTHMIDASSTRDASPSAASACSVRPNNARCTSKPIEMVGSASDSRRVYWATPTTPAPEDGYPTVVLYQGSYLGPATTWNLDIASSAAFGGYYQVALISALLDAGFVVIQPEAQNGVFWSTNTSANYAASSDGVFIPLLLAAIHDGTFGAVDEQKLYATGISSGGYMTSRMAVSYPGHFRALAIESGSYATCAGPVCSVPAALPKDHPPTLFLHGDVDNIVPIATAKDYYQKLMKNGIETKFVEDPKASHEWLSTAPDDVTQWFLSH